MVTGPPESNETTGIVAEYDFSDPPRPLEEDCNSAKAHRLHEVVRHLTVGFPDRATGSYPATGEQDGPNTTGVGSPSPRRLPPKKK